ncbi:glycoside hydrolase domain-containing protein [Kitasatospora sp. NPDC049285]|uniref:glycoside hydrolase domain-containing protein n=1 Tax=Kitasatospora sp. NPDC049285 TaxID=3157096 RepID=UPI003442E576
MRYLGPAALTAASLVLLLATDRDAASLLATDPSAAAPAQGAVALAAPAQAAVAAPAQATAALAGPAPAAPALVVQTVAHEVVPQLGPALTPETPPAPPVVLKRTVLADPLRARKTPLPSEVFAGAGFDACTAPSLETLQAWRDASPYGAVGIYLSGRQRACGQPRLTADWVREAKAMGWRLIPTHVGRQAPCMTTGKPQRIDPATAVQQGKEEAAEAVKALKSLGLRTGTPVYLDIEAYPRGDAACSQAVVDFTLGWTQALHKAGFRSGFYSSTDAGIADLAAAARAGSSPLPDAVWYARWDDHPTTTDGAGQLGTDLWTPHSRIHQYHGNVQETYGGQTLTIDRDQLDGPVAR